MRNLLAWALPAERPVSLLLLLPFDVQNQLLIEAVRIIRLVDFGPPVGWSFDLDLHEVLVLQLVLLLVLLRLLDLAGCFVVAP